MGEIDGVVFINDSKATNLDALVKALESQPEPVVLIAGGKDKGFGFDAIVDLIHDKAKHAVLIGEMADRILQSWSKVVPCSVARTLREAVGSGSTTKHSGRGGAFLTRNIFVRHVQKLWRSRQPIPRNYSGVSKVRLIKRPVKKPRGKRLRAAGQRSAAKYAKEDYSADEPNVKLSRAFVVVLLLHVVAVGGIFAFSALKDQQTATVTGKAATNGQKPSAAQGTQTGGALRNRLHPMCRIWWTHPIFRKRCGETAAEVPDRRTRRTRNILCVQRGDSPAGIAKKFKISYENLSRLTTSTTRKNYTLVRSF